MKKYTLTVVALVTLGMLSCTDESTSVTENIEVENLTEGLNKVIDTNVVVVDSLQNDFEIEIEEELSTKN